MKLFLYRFISICVFDNPFICVHIRIIFTRGIERGGGAEIKIGKKDRGSEGNEIESKILWKIHHGSNLFFDRKKVVYSFESFFFVGKTFSSNGIGK